MTLAAMPLSCRITACPARNERKTPGSIREGRRVAKIKWDVKKQEQLLSAAANHDSELEDVYEYTVDSPVIQRIHAEFNDPEFDVLAVLYQLANLKMVSMKGGSKVSGKFYRQKANIRQDRTKTCPRFPPTTESEVKQIIESIPVHMSSGCKDFLDLCKRLSDENGRTAWNYENLLFENGVAVRGVDGLLRLKPEVSPPPTALMDKFLAAKFAPKEILNEINGHRGNASKLYVAPDHQLPAIIRSTDGTGFGKSYAVFDQFLKNINRSEPGVGHRNLLFITPHKAQINIEQKLIDEANQAGIPLLGILSRQDLAGLDFQDWVTSETNLEKFSRWYRVGKQCPYMGAHLSKLSQTVGQLQAGSAQLAATNDYSERDILEKQITNLSDRCRMQLKDVALAALNQNGSPTTVAALARSTGSLDRLRLEIVSRSFPLERALCESTVLLATTKKFDTHMQMLTVGRFGQYAAKMVDFYELIGACQANENLATSAAVSLNDAAQRQFLREQLFVADPMNKFREKEVAFTVVIDEEHEAYQILAKERKVPLINAETNVSHVLSTLCRVHKSIEGLGTDPATGRPLYKVPRDFFLRAEELLRTKCELSPGQTLKSLIRIFESNIGYVQIEKGDVEQVINITRNVFSFTPKRFFNENALKSIRIRGRDNNTYCQIYFGKPGDTDPTLYDLFQLLLALLAAAAEVNNKDFERMLSDVGNSQNASFADFIRNAANKKREVKYLFDRSLDEDQVINAFFTYFQPKTVFSLEPKKHVEFVDERLNEFVYVDVKLDLLLELPEVSLMRMAHNTRNAVFCLSATTGFESIYNGNYNHNVLRRYGEQGTDNLGYQVVRRDRADLPVLQGLRNARAKIRSVTFHPFSTEKHSILSDREENEVAKQARLWERKLEPNSALMRHKYHLREFRRQLEAILLAAWDQKHTLVLSLSGRIKDIFNDYLANCNYTCKQLKRTIRGQSDIFDFTPFDNGIKLRLIFFHAELDRNVELRNYTQLSEAGQRLVIVAPYKSAGTGLNLFVTYQGSEFREDFNRLVLINSPFYSDVIQRDVGLNSLDNWLTLMKFYADGKNVKLLRDFDVNLVSGENYSVLMREHDMSIFKNLMQALGRVERADSILSSEIFISSDLLDVAMLQFERLAHPGNEVVLGSMSVINQSLREYCKKVTRTRSFATDTQREEFETKVINDQRRIENFFHDFLRTQIRLARKSDKAAADLNEALRSIECITNPGKWISQLLNNPLIASSAFNRAVVASFYLGPDAGLTGVTLCQTKSINGLSDLVGGEQLYRPASRVLPQYSPDIDSKDGKFWQRLSDLTSMNDAAFKQWVPLPAILPLLKGNVGEYLLDGLLDHIGVAAMTYDEVFQKLDPSCYELFDRYVQIDDDLVCIDAKNWGSSIEQLALAQRVQEESERKMEHIQQIVGSRFETIKFVYLNTRYEENPLNLMPEVDQRGAYFLNLLKRESAYKELSGQRAWRGMVKKDGMVINPRLRALLTSHKKKN